MIYSLGNWLWISVAAIAVGVILLVIWLSRNPSPQSQNGLHRREN